MSNAALDKTHTSPILPGATLGVLGGGQLGRMLGLAARRMGYRFAVYTDAADSPAAQIADFVNVGAYDDADAVRDWAKAHCDVVTFEFENVAAEVARAAASVTTVRPDGAILHTTQNRLREKTWLFTNGFPVAPFAPVRNDDELEIALETLALPLLLKTANGGYDGKGQRVLRTAGEAWAAKAEFSGAGDLIVEQFVPFDREISVVVARGAEGQILAYAPSENRHVGGVLDITVAPANLPLEKLRAAQVLAAEIAEELDYVGVLCVEMFVVGSGGDLKFVVNELAPRPHNSGHHTIESCATSQFEQQLRAVCGLPLGDTTQMQAAAMANLLGDLWRNGREPNWQDALALPGVTLHLYGKTEARAGRKMGHITACAETTDGAERLVLAARNALLVSIPPMA